MLSAGEMIMEGTERCQTFRPSSRVHFGDGAPLLTGFCAKRSIPSSTKTIEMTAGLFFTDFFTESVENGIFSS